LAEYHPDREALECFARGEILAAEERWIEEHLRSGCAICQRSIDSLLPRLEEKESFRHQDLAGGGKPLALRWPPGADRSRPDLPSRQPHQPRPRRHSLETPAARAIQAWPIVNPERPSSFACELQMPCDPPQRVTPDPRLVRPSAPPDALAGPIAPACARGASTPAGFLRSASRPPDACDGGDGCDCDGFVSAPVPGDPASTAGPVGPSGPAGPAGPADPADPADWWRSRSAGWPEWAGAPDATASRESTDADNEAWERIFAKLERQLAQIATERDGAPRLLSELLARPATERGPLVCSGRRFQTLTVCDLLIERSFDVAMRDSSEAIALAELGILVADLLDVRHYGSPVVHDLKARAWAYLGNARRIRSDFAGAEQAQAFAEALSEDGSADPLEEARLLDLKASLLADQGWFEEAAELLDAVIEIYHDVKDLHRKGRALVGSGVYAGYCGWPQKAIERIQEGLALLDHELEPRFVLTAKHHLAWFLNDCGRWASAQRHIDGLRQSYRVSGDPWAELRLDWLEARIAQRSGRCEEAEQRLSRLLQRFVEGGLVYEAAMVMLDLATLYLEHGRRSEIRRLADEMLPILLSQDLHRQAVAALVAFQQAAAGDGVTPALAHEIASYLQRARKNPRLSFQHAA
jgi:tetratricopeptide (TPR) repeat protein